MAASINQKYQQNPLGGDQDFSEVLRPKTQGMEPLSTLAGGIAHQFNNALVGIAGNIELLQMDFPEDENIHKYIESMRTSVHRMVGLTNQLLAFARGGKYHPVTLSLNDLVKDSLPIIQSKIAPAIHLETDLPTDTNRVEADPSQMKMVLSALIENATEAIEGQGRIRIATGSDDSDQLMSSQEGQKLGQYTYLRVQDNGKGMDDKTKTRIFEPFFTTKFQGRGLGMAAVYGIVNNHGGWISVDSQVGRGTDVHLYLPTRDN